MPLDYILNSVCEDLGYDPVNQRALLVVMINRAAREIYESQDLPGCLREIVAMVPPDSVVALPYYVGELRAIREYNTRAKIEFKEMAPKYSYNSWPEIWRNWRILKKSPIQNSVENAALPITLSRAAVETSVVYVTVTGATLTSSRVSEVATFLTGDTEVELQTNFTEIHSITKSATNAENITVTGWTNDTVPVEMVLAEIPNDRLAALYTLVDVSQLPGGGDIGNTRYVDVLYKEPLFSMYNDGDTFPCDGFDDAIVYKVLEHEYLLKAEGGDKAVGYYKKAEQFIYNRIIHSNGTTQKELILAPNQYLGLFPKYTPYRPGMWFGLNR